MVVGRDLLMGGRIIGVGKDFVFLVVVVLLCLISLFDFSLILLNNSFDNCLSCYSLNWRRKLSRC